MVPETIGKYKIVKLVAKGGMGAVYKGIHPTLKRYVILKKLTLKGNPDLAERFKREAKLMMDFKNDHIVDVYDHFKLGTSYYIVLEYIDGVSLDKLLERDRYFDTTTALQIFYYVCQALFYAHKKGVVHRDIKPGNIIISKKGEVKLLDFGIASSLEDHDDGLTKDGMILGTPAYMAPEQIDDLKKTDHRADIYSLGVMLYEMITGEKPYQGAFSPEMVQRIRKGKYTPVRKLNPLASSLAVRIIKKCMRVKPKKRFQSLESLLKALKPGFKKMKDEQIHECLSFVVAGQSSPASDDRAVSFHGAKVLFLISLLVLGSAFTYYAYTQKWHYPVFYADIKSEVRINLLVEKNFRGSNGQYLEALFYRLDGNELVTVPVSAEFTYSGMVGDSFYSFMSNTLYMQEGQYRIKLMANNAVFWDSFYLQPISWYRQYHDSSTLKLTYEFAKEDPMPLLLTVNARDEVSGKKLDNISTSIYTQGSWVNLSNELLETLETGKGYRIRVGKEDYYDKQFNVFLENEQNSLFLDIRLQPRTAAFIIYSDLEELQIFVNDKETLKDYDNQRVNKTLPEIQQGRNRINVFPGAYQLRFQQNRAVYAEVSLEIRSNEVKELFIRRDDILKTIFIEVENE